MHFINMNAARLSQDPAVALRRHEEAAVLGRLVLNHIEARDEAVNVLTLITVERHHFCHRLQHSLISQRREALLQMKREITHRIKKSEARLRLHLAAGQ